MKVLRALAFLACVWPAYCSSSTVRVQFGEPALKFASQVAKTLGAKMVSVARLPDIENSHSLGTLNVQRIYVEDYNSPEIQVSLSDDGVMWHTTGGSVTITGVYVVKTGGLFVAGGRFVATAYDIDLQLTTKIWSKDGRPQLQLTKCVSAIGKLGLRFVPEADHWFLNWFTDPISKGVLNDINKKGCGIAEKMLKKGNDALYALPTSVALGAGFFLNYGINTEKFTSQYAQFDVAADVVYGKETQCPSSPVSLPDVTDQYSIATALLSEKVPNCFLGTSYKEFDFTITHENMPDSEGSLQTSCPLMCFGTIFEQLKNTSNGHVALRLTASEPPKLVISTDGMQVNGIIDVDVHLFPKEEHPDVLAKLSLDVRANATGYVKNGKAYFELSDNISTHVTVKSSTIGEPGKFVMTVLDKMLAPQIREVSKGYLSEGFAIPVAEGFAMPDGTITPLADALQFGLNFALA